MKKVSWVEGLGTCQPQTPAHIHSAPTRSICFWIPWNASVRSGRRGSGRGHQDAASPWFPSIGVQGQSNTIAECLDFPLWQTIHWSFLGLSLTLVFLWGQLQGGNNVQRTQKQVSSVLLFHVALSDWLSQKKTSYLNLQRNLEDFLFHPSLCHRGELTC